MAKMKISELATEINVDKNEIVKYLQSIGFECKSATKSIEDEQIDAIKAKFAGSGDTKQTEKKKKAAAVEAEPETDKAPKTVKAKAEPEKAAPAAEKAESKHADDEKRPEGMKKKRPNGEIPKKKKSSVIIVAAGNNGQKRMNSRPGQAQSPRSQVMPSKPVVLGPNQMINKATGKVMEKLPPKRHEAVEESTTAPVRTGETTAAERSADNTRVNRDDRPVRDNSRIVRDNRDKRFGERSDFRGERNETRGQAPDGRNSRNFDSRDRGAFAGNKNRDGSQGPNRFGGRNGGSDSRVPSRDGRPSDKFRDNKQNSFMDAPVGGKPNDNRRGKNNLGKDKKSKKDAIYEEEDIRNKNKAGRFIKPEKKEEVVEEIKVITLPEVITIKELADKMKMQPSVIVKKLFLQGQMVTVNQEISYEEAENIAIEYDIMCEQEVKVDVIEELLKEDEEDEANLVGRAPVICVMGHVDHGKTSLLDAIRKTNVTDREAGGITQHIGAYTVDVDGKKITFLDTPGHEAFTAMRMRGANATDIAILVVAADDGVMPQTIEAINHAKAAGIEIIVAVNKIDKPSANIDRVKQELTEYELVAEDWGGSTVFAPVSAKTGEGIRELLDMVLLTADILELKANPKRKARGLVIEAELDKGRGPVATILMQKGTLKVGDFVSAGACHGKVRAMIDDKGRNVKEAGPSTPVEILGLNDVPEAGEVFIAHDNDKTAKSFADTYKAQNKAKKLEETKTKMSLDDVFSQIQEGNLKELNLIVKADVQGSVEAVKQSLTKLTNEEVVVKCIHGGVGAVNESDVSLAAASNAIIIGFNVRVDANAKETAEREGVDVRLYKVIYQAIDDVEAAMKGMLDPVFEEKIIGHAEVRQLFKASAVGNIAGSYVLDGVFQRGCKVRITREGEQIFEGELASLKRFKDDVKEVKAGFECGLVFEGFDAMQELDIVEAYIMVEVPR